MSRFFMLAAALVAAGAVSGCATPTYFQSNLSGTQEAPPTASAGTGVMTAKLYPDTRSLDYKVEYTGLSGPATAAHIHAPAAAGANAPVAVPLKSTASPITGASILTDDQVKALMDGKAYINIHTAANPGGEIRGQIARVQ